eukprot:g5480.t1
MFPIRRGKNTTSKSSIWPKSLWRSKFLKSGQDKGTSDTNSNFKDLVREFWTSSLLVRASRAELLGIDCEKPVNARMVLQIDLYESRCLHTTLNISTIEDLYSAFRETDNSAEFEERLTAIFSTRQLSSLMEKLSKIHAISQDEPMSKVNAENKNITVIENYNTVQEENVETPKKEDHHFSAKKVEIEQESKDMKIADNRDKENDIEKRAVEVEIKIPVSKNDGNIEKTKKEEENINVTALPHKASVRTKRRRRNRSKKSVKDTIRTTKETKNLTSETEDLRERLRISSEVERVYLTACRAWNCRENPLVTQSLQKGAEILDLSHIGLGHNGCRSLVASLGTLYRRNLCSVKKLVLKNNLLRSAGGRIIGGFLAHNPPLEELDLSENMIGQGARDIAMALRVNDHLKVLKLDDNSMIDNNAQTLITALMFNQTIIRLHIVEKNIVKPETRLKLAELLQKRGAKPAESGLIVEDKNLNVNADNEKNSKNNQNSPRKLSELPGKDLLSSPKSRSISRSSTDIPKLYGSNVDRYKYKNTQDQKGKTHPIEEDITTIASNVHPVKMAAAKAALRKEREAHKSKNFCLSGPGIEKVEKAHKKVPPAKPPKLHKKQKVVRNSTTPPLPSIEKASSQNGFSKSDLMSSNSSRGSSRESNSSNGTDDEVGLIGNYKKEKKGKKAMITYKEALELSEEERRKLHDRLEAKRAVEEAEKEKKRAELAKIQAQKREEALKKVLQQQEELRKVKERLEAEKEKKRAEKEKKR